MFHPMNGTDFLTAAGERERAEPLLYASMPLRGYTGKARPPFDMHPANTRLRVAPYDVHATLRDLTGLPPRGLGKSLRHPLGKRSCAEAGVPAHFCRGASHPRQNHTSRLPTQPSLFSYYSDLGSSVPTAFSCGGKDANDALTHDVGSAAVATRQYLTCNCSTRPSSWSSVGCDADLRPAGGFVAINCDASPLPPQLHARVGVSRDPQLLARVRARASASRGQPSGAARGGADGSESAWTPPSVLILQIDSLSHADLRLEPGRAVPLISY